MKTRAQDFISIQMAPRSRRAVAAQSPRSHFENGENPGNELGFQAQHEKIKFLAQDEKILLNGLQTDVGAPWFGYVMSTSFPGSLSPAPPEREKREISLSSLALGGAGERDPGNEVDVMSDLLSINYLLQTVFLSLIL